MTVPETPQIIANAVPCYLTLIDLTTSPETQEQFDTLSRLMTSAIIGGAWTYGGKELKTMEASVQVLAPIVRALGIGNARFLKARHCLALMNSSRSLFILLPVYLRL